LKLVHAICALGPALYIGDGKVLRLARRTVYAKGCKRRCNPSELFDVTGNALYARLCCAHFDLLDGAESIFSDN